MTDDVLILTNEETKRCSLCGRELLITHFHKSNNNKDGYQSWCIECKREYNKARIIFRISRRLGISRMSISEILGALKNLSRGELLDAKVVFEQALKVINRQIKN